MKSHEKLLHFSTLVHVSLTYLFGLMTRQPLEMNLFFLYVLFVAKESMVKILLFDLRDECPPTDVSSPVKDSPGDFVSDWVFR